MEGTLWGFLAEAPNAAYWFDHSDLSHPQARPRGIWSVYARRHVDQLDRVFRIFLVFTNDHQVRKRGKRLARDRHTVLRLQLACGLAATVLLWLTVNPIAILLDQPRLEIYLKLFALEPLIFVLAWAHRGILIGVGRFREQAFPRAARWLARLLLIVRVRIFCQAIVELCHATTSICAVHPGL
jgi:hypothetical protein